MKKIAIFGAHDRFNYGDLLFPIVVKSCLNNMFPGQFQFDVFSLVKANLTPRGGFAVGSYRSLKKAVANKRIGDIIVSGGEVLCANTDNLYYYINPVYRSLLYRKYIGRFLSRFAFAKKIIGTALSYPYCLDPSEFGQPVNVYYNAVGGGWRQSDNTAIQSLGKSKYLSVRDRASAEHLSKMCPFEVLLVPDSAIVISDIYRKEDLLNDESIRTNPVRNLVQAEGRYIFLQTSNNINENQFRTILDQLEAIASLTSEAIVLCPIGTALGHEDHIMLGRIDAELKRRHVTSVLIENPTLKEIALLLSHASFYIGTSLHGVITSMSYNVPYYAMAINQPKLNHYLNTWAIEELSEPIPLDNLGGRIQENYANHERLVRAISQRTSESKSTYYSSIYEIGRRLIAQ